MDMDLMYPLDPWDMSAEEHKLAPGIITSWSQITADDVFSLRGP